MFKKFAILSLLIFFVPVHRIQAVSPCPSLKEFPPLHAEENFIYDSSGRTVLLHGVNVPGNYYYPFPFTDADLDIIKSFGFNFIRLGINWAYAEPKEGEYDMQYINSYKTFIKEAGKRKIYVMPEVHQVSWCMAGGAVPDWMCTEKIQNPNDMIKVLKEADRFWKSAELQEKIIRFWEFLVSQFKELDAVFGYNIMNEPISGSCLTYGNFEKNYLFPFYKKMIQAMRKIDSERPVIIEPCGFSPVLPNSTEPFPFPNLIFSPHPYFLHAYDNSGKLLVLDQESIPKLQKKYNRYVEEAKKMNVPMLVGEFGGPQNYDFVEGWLKESLRLLDFYFIGWAFWTYNPGDQVWSVLDEKGKIKPFYWKLLRRPYPVFTPGIPVSLSFSEDKKVFSYSFKPSPKACGPLEIFVPEEMMEESTLNVIPQTEWSYEKKEQRLILMVAPQADEVHVELKPK